jgi:sacsin
MIAVPTIKNIQFLDAPWSSLSLKLLNDLKLATCLRTFEVIEKYIIPNWNFLLDTNVPYSGKEQIARVVFSQYSCLSPSSRIKLKALPMIPVARINGEISSKFSIAADLIDPSISGLKKLFFDDEEVVPESSFFTQFHALINDIGLKAAVDETLVSSRTLSYANSNRPLLEIEKRVHTLLQSSCRWDSTKGSSEGLVLRHLEWLPVLDLEGALCLKSPVQCRPLRDKLLVSSQLPLFDIPLSAEWEARLGWCDILPKHVLLRQLKQGLQTDDRAVVDAILTYIVEKDQTALFISDLQSLPCILTSFGLYVTASKAFRPPASRFTSCERLRPYLGNIDKKFWKDHEILLSGMEIGEKPSLDHLLAIQKALESQLPLSEPDTAVAIEILHLASRFPRSSSARLKVPSKDGDFCLVHEIYYNNLGILTPTEEVNLTHPDIPLVLAQRLGIELLSDLLMKGLLEIADIDDEDEFEQHEKITTRIVDTLDRYPIDNTFREYLANADDTIGTSKISWLLDERTHADKSLLTTQLKPLQGPALLVHNDGG